MVTAEELKIRHFVEYLNWRIMSPSSPVFRYVQDPVFNLTTAEMKLLDFLHRRGLHFTVRPRYDPSSFITMSVELGHVTQNVRIEMHLGLTAFGVFIVKRSPFADNLKGWLDHEFGTERFAAPYYVATRHYMHFPYIMPVDADIIDEVLKHPPTDSDDYRYYRHFFNFTAKEIHFLNSLETTIQRQGKSAYSAKPNDDSILSVQVYPRQTTVGSIELVLQKGLMRQPARIFVSGYRPITYQAVTENSALVEPLKQSLDCALGENNFDEAASHRRGKYASLIYNVRYDSKLLDSFEDDQDEDE